MALADLLNTFKKKKADKSIIGKVERHLMRTNRSRDLRCVYDGERRSDVYHPSSISRVDCYRKLVFMKLNTKRSNDTYNSRSQRIFDTGHDFGYRMQGYFWDMGILLGKWHCVECKYTWLDLENPSPQKCPKCGVEFEIWYNLHYLEVPINNEARNIIGKSDGLLDLDWGRLFIELKTIKNRDAKTSDYATCFEDLNEPKNSHLGQITLYMDGFRSQHKPKHEGDLKHGLIIYGAKNTQEWKEYEVTLIPELAYRLYTKIDMIEGYIEDKDIPPRAGENKSKGECRWCDWKDLCWEEELTFRSIDNRGNE